MRERGLLLRKWHDHITARPTNTHAETHCGPSRRSPDRNAATASVRPAEAAVPAPAGRHQPVRPGHQAPHSRCHQSEYRLQWSCRGKALKIYIYIYMCVCVCVCIALGDSVSADVWDFTHTHTHTHIYSHTHKHIHTGCCVTRADNLLQRGFDNRLVKPRYVQHKQWEPLCAF